MRASAIKIQALARAVTARERVKALRRLHAATNLQRFERGRRARAYFRKHLQAVSIMQRWSRARLQRIAFLRVLRLIQRLQHWFHRVVKAIRLHKKSLAAIEIQRRWRGILGRQAAKKQLEALTRLQGACRKLVLRWRRRVLERIRQKLYKCSLQVPHAEDQVCPHPPCTTLAQEPEERTLVRTFSQMLERCRRSKSSRGELNAASALLQCQNGALASQAQLLHALVEELQLQLHNRQDRCCLFG